MRRVRGPVLLVLPFAFFLSALAEHFARERKISQRALRLTVEVEHRKAVAWRFSEADISGNNGTVDLVAKVLLQLIRHLLREHIARVVHGTQQAFDL